MKCHIFWKLYSTSTHILFILYIPASVIILNSILYIPASVIIKYLFLVLFQGGKKKKVSVPLAMIEEAQVEVKYFHPTRDDQNTWIPVFIAEEPEDQLGQKEFKNFLEKQGEIGFTDFSVPFDEMVTRRGRELIRKAFRSK